MPLGALRPLLFGDGPPERSATSKKYFHPDSPKRKPFRADDLGQCRIAVEEVNGSPEPSMGIRHMVTDVCMSRVHESMWHMQTEWDQRSLSRLVPYRP